jgi:hypothetical protein
MEFRHYLKRILLELELLECELLELKCLVLEFVKKENLKLIFYLDVMVESFENEVHTMARNCSG